MAVVLERPKPGVVIVRAEYSPDEVRKKIDEIVAKYRKELNIPGFRPGKAPKSIILSRYGEYIRQEVKQEFLQNAVDEAVKQMPELDSALFVDEPKVGEIEEGKPFTVEIYAEVKPEIEVKKYKGFELEKPEVPVEESEVDAAVEDILSRNATLEERQRPVQENDYVEVKFSEEGQEPIPMLIPLDDPEFAQFFGELVGKSAGDVVGIEAQFPEAFPDRRLRGKSGRFKLEIVKVMEQVRPELNEEFFKKIGKPDGYTAEDFRNEVREFIKQQKSRQSTDELRRQVVEKLVRENPVEVPEKYLMSRVDQYIAERVDPSKIKQEDLEKLRNELKSSIGEEITFEFVADKIAEIEEIKVEDREVLDAARGVLASMGYDPNIAEQLYKPGTEEFERLRRRVIRDRVIDLVMANSSVRSVPHDESRDASNQSSVEAAENWVAEKKDEQE